MASPHSDKPFPTLKIGLLNPNGMSSVSRTDQNNNTYQLNKLQVLLQEANTLGLSILGLSETHHFKFPANMREFSSEHEDSASGGASLVILDETISVIPQNVVKGYNYILAPLLKNGTLFHVLVVYLHPELENAKKTIKETKKFSSLGNLIVLGDMNCIGSIAPINSSTSRKDPLRAKFNHWCDKLSVVDTIYYHFPPTQLGQHTRISGASSSRIDQILASPDISWRTRTHSTKTSFSDHNMVYIHISDSPTESIGTPKARNSPRVKPYMVAPAADKIDNLISKFFPPHKSYEPNQAASKMESLKKALPPIIIKAW